MRPFNGKSALALALGALPWTAQAATPGNPLCPMLNRAVALAPSGFASIEGKVLSTQDGGAWVSTLQFSNGSDICSVDAGLVLRCYWGKKDIETFNGLVELTADCFPKAARSSLDMVTSDPPWQTFTLSGADISIHLSFGFLTLTVASVNLGK